VNAFYGGCYFTDCKLNLHTGLLPLPVAIKKEEIEDKNLNFYL
jgi:hypothetical protein